MVQRQNVPPVMLPPPTPLPRPPQPGVTYMGSQSSQAANSPALFPSGGGPQLVSPGISATAQRPCSIGVAPASMKPNIPGESP